MTAPVSEKTRNRERFEQLQARPLHSWHCWRILGGLNVPAAKLSWGRTRWLTFRHLLQLRRQGPSAAIFYRHRLLAVAGIAGAIPGVGEAWSVHSAALSELRLGVPFIWFCRHLLGAWLRDYRYHRVHACVSVDGRLSRWLRVLGFVLETRLRCADAAGGDMLVYAIIREPQS